ncbi:MAG: hypothetical protein ABI778_02060 [Ignavibacteriota bacterium]
MTHFNGGEATWFYTCVWDNDQQMLLFLMPEKEHMPDLGLIQRKLQNEKTAVEMFEVMV